MRAVAGGAVRGSWWGHPRGNEIFNLAGALSTTRPGGTEAFRDAKYRDDFFRANGQSSGNARKQETAS